MSVTISAPVLEQWAACDRWPGVKDFGVKDGLHDTEPAANSP